VIIVCGSDRVAVRVATGAGGFVEIARILGEFVEREKVVVKRPW